ncbi:MAG: rhodanese-like domain-containing protein [Gemmatimonadota bacterium]
MFFRQVFDPDLAQYAYIIGCQRTGEAIVIDPQRDVDRYIAIAAEEGLTITSATETHIHADFLSGTVELASQHGARLFLSGEGTEEWRYHWADDGPYDATLLKDGDTFHVGNIGLQVIHTPGHTPEHIAFLVTDHGGGADEPIGLASGDFVFVGALGRPDLLETAAGVSGAREPAARALYQSTKRFLELDDHVQVWPGHGAGSACGKALGSVPQSTVGYERRFNAGLSFAEERGFIESILDGQPEPPLYFARMKELNRRGIPVLGGLPQPKLFSVEDMVGHATTAGSVVIDTRSDRAAFAAGHIPGSIYAPLGINFAMVVGSYVDPEDDIYLLADAEGAEAAARILVRIGYDNVKGYAPPSTLLGSGVADATTRRIDFSELDPSPDTDTATVLDVRGAAEYSGSHIPGALHIAYTRLAGRLDEVPMDRPVLVHCRSGNRASFAVSFLEREGYDVTFVDGMYTSWPGLPT